MSDLAALRERVLKMVHSKTTDYGNAERLVFAEGDSIRYTPTLGWLCWDGKRWERDAIGMPMVKAKATIRAYHALALNLDDEEKRKAHLQWALKSESAAQLSSMLRLAQSEPAFALRREQLDADGDLLNCANGTVDLRTGELRPHSPGDYITKLSPVAFDSDAACPVWTAFLERVVPDLEVRNFLARWCGYSLTADVREDALAFLYGTGANGKSIFLTALRRILGEYAIKAPRGLLLATRNEKHPTELMTLRGARFAWCSEVDEAAIWDESKVKDLASSDPVTARAMRKDDVTWTPTHKLWIAGNHRPRVTGTDDGIWRRLRLVPFDVTIPKEEQDKHLADKLSAELPGILAWAVRGCLDWRANGLGEPAAVAGATEAYRAAEDGLGRFIADCCHVPTDPRDRVRITVSASSLFVAYQEWSEAQGERPMTQKRFVAALADRDHRAFIHGKDSKGCKTWTGIGLVSTKVHHGAERWAS